MGAFFHSVHGRKISLQYKLLLSFIFILSVTFFTTGYSSYRYNLQISEHEISEQFLQNVEQVQSKLTVRLQEIYRVSSYINFEPYVIRALQESDQTTKYEDQVQLQRLLNLLMVDMPHLLSIYLYDTEGNNYRPTSSLLYSDLNTRVYEQILRNTESSDGELVWMKLPLLDYNHSEDKNDVVIAARRLKNRELGSYGTLVLFFHERIFDNELKNAIKGEQANVYLFDNRGQMIYTDDLDKSIGVQPLYYRENGSKTKNIDGDTFIFSQSYSEQTGFTLVSRMATKNLHKKSKVILQVAIINGLISIFLAGSLLLFANQRLLRPLKQLVIGMKKLRKGQLDTRVTVHTNDELAFIGESFNLMVDDLNRLIKEVYEKELLQSKAELAALQAQLNPHFLYNTLDMIHSRMYLQGDTENAEIVVALSRMLRYALESSRSPTTLARELEQLKNYLTIQQHRFEGQLEIKIDIDDELLACEFNRLLLQPIVENAFVHGFRDQLEKKRLCIKGWRQHDFLIIQVTDNGCGMNGQLLAKINEGQYSWEQQDPSLPSMPRIGLANVMRRIEMIYGYPYHLKVFSEEEKGTTVTFYLPYRKHHENGGGE